MEDEAKSPELRMILSAEMLMLIGPRTAFNLQRKRISHQQIHHSIGRCDTD
jgi:hypothetical protein